MPRSVLCHRPLRIAAAVTLFVIGQSDVRADSKRDVNAMVRKHLEQTPDLTTADAFVLARGGRIKADEAVGVVLDLNGDYGEGGGGTDTKVTKLDVVTDDARGTAWFHGRATINVTFGGKEPPRQTLLRINGIAIKDKTWKIVALSYSEGISDKDMIEQAKDVKPALAMPAAVVVRGDATLAKAASAWFTGAALAGGASRGGLVVANGTADSEYASGAKAVKLAAAWDKLKLAAYKVEAKTFTSGNIGFVRAVVALPITKPRRIVPLVLAGVAVQENGEWRWVSLSWTDFTFPPNSDPVDVR